MDKTEAGAETPSQDDLSSALRRNIEALESRRERERTRAPWTERVADVITRFAGSMTFVGIHLLLYGFWILANLGWLPGVPRFDPTFVVLAMEASVEAIFLSTFVLITQNRMSAMADKRADLDLHINLLTEHELTKLAVLLSEIAEKLGVRSQAHSELEEIKQDVRPANVLDAIESKQD